MAWVYFGLLALMSGAIFYVMHGRQLIHADKASKSILLATAILVPVISLLIYQQRGASDEVALVEAMKTLNESAGSAQPSDPLLQESMEAFQSQLEAITQAKPDKAEYWFLLGGLRTERQDFDGAVDAYQQASRLFPEDVSIYARLAEAQFLADGYLLSEAVRGHIDRVLAENPFDTTVLGILGISAYRAGQFDAAIAFWEKSLQVLPPMSAASQSIRASIEQAKVAGGVQNSNELSSFGTENADAGLMIDLDVSIDASIAVEDETTVFVFARQFGGPPMPIVVERLTAGQLPARVTLDDSKVMIQGRKLADFQQLELVARLSFSGQPAAQDGDYEVVIGPVNPAQVNTAIALRISDKISR